MSPDETAAQRTARRRLWWYDRLPGPLADWFWIASSHYLVWRRRGHA